MCISNRVWVYVHGAKNSESRLNLVKGSMGWKLKRTQIRRKWQNLAIEKVWMDQILLHLQSVALERKWKQSQLQELDSFEAELDLIVPESEWESRGESVFNIFNMLHPNFGRRPSLPRRKRIDECFVDDLGKHSHICVCREVVLLNTIWIPTPMNDTVFVTWADLLAQMLFQGLNVIRGHLEDKCSHETCSNPDVRSRCWAQDVRLRYSIL